MKSGVLLCLATISLCALLAFPVPFAAQSVEVDSTAKQHFTIINIRVAGKGQVQGTWIGGFNSAGEIAGYYVDSGNVAHGFLRSTDGKITKINVSAAGKGSGQGTVLFSIDLSGAVAGYYVDSGNVAHGFLRSADGRNHQV
jgi:hypothetical protein